MTLFSKYLFKGTTEDMAILRGFYLGYCMNDKQTYDISQPNFAGIRN